MTEKRPTLTLKPKAPTADTRRGRAAAKGAGPSRPGGAAGKGPSGPQAGQGGGRPQGGAGNAAGRPQGKPAGPREAGPRDDSRRDGGRAPGAGRDAGPRGDNPRTPRGDYPRSDNPRADNPRGPGNTPPRGTQRIEYTPRNEGPRHDAPRDDGPRLRQSHEVKAPVQLDYRPDVREDALAFALLGAASSLARVRAGTALPQALAEVFQAYDAPPQARGAMQDIAYRAMRQLGRSGTLLNLMTSKAPEPAMLAGLLECALTLLDPPEGTEPPYEAFTVVDQAVGAAAAHPDFAHAKAMVNAVLRRFLREREGLVAAALRESVAQWNYPQWWIDAVRTAYPQAWQAILTAGNRQPPLTLRVNRRRTDVATYLQTLAAAGMQAEQVGPSAVRLVQAVGVAQIPGFADGLVSVQDAGAQLAAPLLDVHDGMHVLDACAAPGGKSGHILETADVDLTALDADPRRLVRVDQNLERLGLSATVKAGSAEARDWWDGRLFDRILADVPCTASGIVRRHPDIRWLRRKSDTHQLATLSSKILDNLWQMLKPDGKLLFVTCSLWPQESEAQAAAFAVRHGAVRLDAPGQLLPHSGAGQDHDGLFYALFQKTGA